MCLGFGKLGQKRVAKALMPIDVSSLANSKYTTLKEPKSKKKCNGTVRMNGWQHGSVRGTQAGCRKWAANRTHAQVTARLDRSAHGMRTVNE